MFICKMIYTEFYLNHPNFNPKIIFVTFAVIRNYEGIQRKYVGFQQHKRHF